MIITLVLLLLPPSIEEAGCEGSIAKTRGHSGVKIRRADGVIKSLLAHLSSFNHLRLVEALIYDV